MEPDLSASIMMHPHPFRIEHAEPSSRSPSLHPRPSNAGHGNNNASSTGVQVKVEKADAAVERHSVNPMSPGASSDHSGQTVGGATDVESQTTAGAGGASRLPRVAAESDPYGLSSAYKTQSDIEQMKTTATRKRNVNSHAPASEVARDAIAGGTAAAGGASGGNNNNSSDDNNNGKTLLAQCFPMSFSLPSLRPLVPSLLPSVARRAMQTKKLKSFYTSQNETIERLLKTVEEHQAEARQEQGDDQLKFRIGVYGSFAANMILAALQIYGAVSSGSLSLFTTMADAVFDPMSNVTLIVTNRAVKRVDPSRFPSGKARLETIGNIVFCFLMTAVSFILIAFSIRELADGRREEDSSTNKFHLPSVIAVVIAFATKLALFFYTWALKDRYSQMYILWQDHRNDLLINGFGILTSVGGSKLIWYIDPIGAIVLSIVVSAIWLRTAFTEFLLLVGVVASVEIQQLITYVCVTHSPAVHQIDTVRVYHSGPRLIAEIDIVMSPDATLTETHDVAESLQQKLECLPDVERAYVHVDYETTHKPEHAWKKDL